MYKRLKLLFPYINRYKSGYIFGILTLVATDIFMLLTPKVVGNAIDSLKMPSPPHPIYWYILIFILLAVCENICRFLWRFFLIGSSRKVERDLMNDFFAHLLKLNPSFFDKTPTGDLMARATNDVGSIRMLLGPGTMSLCDAIVVFGVTIFFMLSLNSTLTIYAMAPLPILIVIIGLILRKIHISFDIVQAQFSTISARAQESMSGIRVVKAHNREEYETGEFDKVTTDYVKKYMFLTKYDSLLEPIIRFVAGIGVVVTLYVGGLSVIQNKMTIGQLVQFFLYLMKIVWPVIAIGWSANLFERGMASLARLQAILSEKPTISDIRFGPEMSMIMDTRIPKPPPDIHQKPVLVVGDIQFINVSFRYKPDSPLVLKGINLIIKKGTTLGIVGPLGCGKSSLLNLIPRLYDPTEGEILIGGRNIKDLSIQDLRRHIGCVPQESFLFSRNIIDNMNLGRTNDPLAEEEIQNALELADIYKDVFLFPNKLQTTLGERGLRLSGGQKQRMTIARAMAKNPDIVLLDDTLSSVDTHTEERIIQNLKSFGEGRTNIIVSHRISSVKDADKIIVLSDGEITERGTHSELLLKEGFYAKLYKQQRLAQHLQEQIKVM